MGILKKSFSVMVLPVKHKEVALSLLCKNFAQVHSHPLSAQCGDRSKSFIPHKATFWINHQGEIW